jgi:hypothetical protein
MARNRPLFALVLTTLAFAPANPVSPAPPAAPDAGSAPPASATTAAIRRLTESEYRHIIADVLDARIEINARFETEKREEGLLAIGSGMLALSPRRTRRLRPISPSGARSGATWWMASCRTRRPKCRRGRTR